MKKVNLFDRIDQYHGDADGLMDIDELTVWHGHDLALPEPSRAANDEYWYMELEVQLLCNEAEQADSVY